MIPRKVLYIEANIDGTIGGSHHCLLEMVKYIDRKKYLPSVLFYQDNALVPDFKMFCQVYIFKINKGFIIEKDLPMLYTIIKENNTIKKLILFYQRTHNFFGYYIPHLLSIYKFLLKHKFDIIHANNSPDLTDWLILSKLLKIKMISHLRFPLTPTNTRKYLIGQYDAIISISNYVTKRLITEKIHCHNVVTIHDGIDIQSIQKHKNYTKDLNKEFDIGINAPVIGVIGNIRWWKGQHVAIESMKDIVNIHKNIRCIFVGEISNSEEDAEYYKNLSNLVVKYNIGENIIFTGYRKDVLNILSRFDILVHTSILPEPLGRVILEGMVLRKPVIATKHGGPVECIEDEISGFLVPPDNPILLSEKILFLLENKEVSKMVGENARKRVEEKFNIERNVKKVEEVYSILYKR